MDHFNVYIFYPHSGKKHGVAEQISAEEVESMADACVLSARHGQSLTNARLITPPVYDPAFARRIASGLSADYATLHFDGGRSAIIHAHVRRSFLSSLIRRMMPHARRES